MHKRLLIGLSLLSICLAGLVQAQQAASDKSPAGAWAGSWTGGSNGTFEMSISKDADGKLGGQLTPKPEGGESYTATFNSVTVSAGKLTIKMVHPDGEVEITLEVTVDGSNMKGTYSVRTKADGSEVDRGTLTASKKS